MGAGLARAGETPEAVGDRGQCPQMARAFWFQARRRRKRSDIVGRTFVFLLFFLLSLKLKLRTIEE